MLPWIEKNGKHKNGHSFMHISLLGHWVNEFLSFNFHQFQSVRFSPPTLMIFLTEPRQLTCSLDIFVRPSRDIITVMYRE